MKNEVVLSLREISNVFGIDNIAKIEEEKEVIERDGVGIIKVTLGMNGIHSVTKESASRLVAATQMGYTHFDCLIVPSEQKATAAQSKEQAYMSAMHQQANFQELLRNARPFRNIVPMPAAANRRFVRAATGGTRG